MAISQQFRIPDWGQLRVTQGSKGAHSSKKCLSGYWAVSGLRSFEGVTGEYREYVPLPAAIQERGRNDSDGAGVQGNELYTGDRFEHVIPALGTHRRLFWHAPR